MDRISVGIKDCKVQTFRTGGKGGQNRDKRDTGVRVVHEPSGAIGISSESRTQRPNKVLAFQRMAESIRFQNWARRQLIKEQPKIEMSTERVRTYNFAKGYVKDHRTGKKTTDVYGVINGDLDLVR